MDNETILFVCEHGAAKSIIASAYFNKLAAENGLDIRSIARGIHPDSELSAAAVSGLTNDGLTPAESAPLKLSIAEVESAQRVVTFCELPGEYQGKSTSDSWSHTPAVSDGYEAARDAIVERVEELIKQLNR